MKTGAFIIIACLSAQPHALSEETVRPSGIGSKMIPDNTGAPFSDVSSDEAFIARRAKASMNIPAPQRQQSKPSAFGLMVLFS